ncbi:MAG: PSD1 and planctomycete cytochrome C domain-containing protein [Planctomycetales bacterium]
MPGLRRTAWVLLASAAALQAASGRGDEPALTEEQVHFFEQKIRPLLIERCYQCHSQSKPVKGGLLLDSRQGWQKGGETGPAIVPGRPEESLLLKAVRYQDADLQMPPAGKLPDAQIAVLEEWVRQGAPDPRDESVADPAGEKWRAVAGEHWAYQPLRVTPPSATRDAGWPLQELDRFVLAALEGKELHPSPDADRHTWLRRVSLDLTGLPPTAEEVRAFALDQSMEAWENAVDRLLSSRAYGERWARPWLDLVGYADQIGSANNVPAPEAWRYRDYVIRAVAQDKPFDEFIREQLAGDLLSAESIERRQDQLTATGFLVLGNVNIVEADKLVMRMDLVDQQVEKVGKAFLGMTLNCVRCHDHKFDPITLGDYYGLAGIFASTESTYKESRGVWSSVTRVPLPETLEQFTQREAALRQHEKRVAAVEGERSQAEARLKELVPLIAAAKGTGAVPEGAKPLAELEKEHGDLSGKVRSLQQQLWHLAYLAPAPPMVLGVKEAPDIHDARTQVRGNPYVLGPTMPRGFVAVATHGESPRIDGEQSGRAQLAQWLTQAASPLVARVTVNRIWAQLFGRGLVASVDYFGVRGEPPTHPELLDFLADRFLRRGWSRRALIRELVLSRTYRQSALADEHSRAALALDPDNRWLWRMSPRRLEAEMIRDCVLAVSGGLQATMGGPSLSPEFMENVGGLDPKDVNPISFSLSKFRDEQQRVRTIYLPVVRSSEQRGPGEVLNFFDFAQPARLTGDRPTTAVASQSLFLLNGPLLGEGAGRLAASVLSNASLASVEARLESLYVTILGRPPAPDEMDAAREFLAGTDVVAGGGEASAAVTLDTWRRLIHALMASNEFLFRL